MAETPSPLSTPLCSLLRTKFPIIQTGMGWISDSRLTAATSAAGGLGILAGATLTPDELADEVRAVKEITDAPFGVNFLVSQPGAAEIVDIIIAEEVHVVSFSRGPDPDLFRRFEDAGSIVIPTIGAPRHAEKVAAWGADAVIAQGREGGGHTGTTASSVLIPAVVDAVDIPVIAAGGFADGRGFVAALALGASGIAMGTRFLLTAESPAPSVVKERYVAAGPGTTVVTDRIDGLPVRVLYNPLVASLENTGTLRSLPFALRSAMQLRKTVGASWSEFIAAGKDLRKREGLTWAQGLRTAQAAMLYRAGVLDGDIEHGALASGQVVAGIDDLPTVEALLDEIMTEAAEVLDRLSAMQTPERSSHQELV